MSRPSHGWPTVLRCTCGRLEQEHDLRPATTKLPERRVGTDNGACPGFELAGVEERPPASVLRARLEAVLALPTTPGAYPERVVDVGERISYVDGWNDAIAAVRHAARGETR